MRVKSKHSQHRRDCLVNLECENCGHTEKNVSAYDDRNFWDNVIPNRRCTKCEKTTIELGGKAEYIETRYSEYENI